MPPEDNLESDVEDNTVVDEVKFIEGDVVDTNADSDREEYRKDGEDLMVTVVPRTKED